MLEKITLVVTEADKVIDKVSKETSTNTADLLDSLIQFQIIVNDSLTKLILTTGDSAEPLLINEDDFSEDSASEENALVSPKKRKT